MPFLINLLFSLHSGNLGSSFTHNLLLIYQSVRCHISEHPSPTTHYFNYVNLTECISLSTVLVNSTSVHVGFKTISPEFYICWRCKKKGHGTAVLPNIENVLPNNKVSLFNSQHLNRSPKIPTTTIDITVGLFEFFRRCQLQYSSEGNGPSKQVKRVKPEK